MRSEQLDEFLGQKAREAEAEFKEKVFFSLDEWKKNSNETLQRLENLHIDGQDSLNSELERLKRNFLFLQEQLKSEISTSFRTHLNALEEANTLLASRSAALKTLIEEKLDGQQQTLDRLNHNLQDQGSQNKVFAKETQDKLQALEKQADTIIPSLSLEFQSIQRALSEHSRVIEALIGEHHNKLTQYHETTGNLLMSATRKVEVGLEKQDLQIKIGENLLNENAVAADNLKRIIDTLQENSRDFTQQIQRAIEQQEAIRAVSEKETAIIKLQLQKHQNQMLIGFAVLGAILISILLIIVL